jgi:hypothetical protein
MKEENPRKRISKMQILIQTMSDRNLRMAKNASWSCTLTNRDIGVHIQYDRPVRLTMGDFLKVYSTDNRTITVSDNKTGIRTEPLMTFGKHEPRYSYYSDRK